MYTINLLVKNVGSFPGHGTVELCVGWGAVGLKVRFCEILSPN